MFCRMSRGAVFLCISAVLLLAQAGGHAQTTRPPLKFFKNYFLTGGDYAVGGVGVRGTGNPATLLATGEISMSGVPQGADISAAFLYWITLEPSNSTTTMSDVAYFRGQEIRGKELNPSGVNVPGCWGSGGGGATSQATTAKVYRADVLRQLPLARNPATPGKVLVNTADISADNSVPGSLPSNSPTHQVKLRDSGGGGTQSPSSGNQVSYAEGAGLVVVYRVPTAPLRAVIIYDGAVTADADFPNFDLTMRGFYQSSATPGAKMTHLVGNGDAPFLEATRINGALVPGTNQFWGSSGSAWDNPTYPVTLAANDSAVTTSVQPTGNSMDCLEWGAVVFSTEVADVDHDGIVDAIEDANPALSDPDGASLPNLKLMGAGSEQPDLFVEFGYMVNPTPTASAPNPWSASSGVGAHSHLPAYEALKMAGDAFKRAGIRAHFDVGPNYQSELADGYIIGMLQGAQGGEAILEKACGTSSTTCQFPNHPGTVGWKSGYQYFRDSPVNADGSQMTPAQEAACETSGGCKRRFDANRFDIFHYSLWAHALGLPKSADQCAPPSTLDANAGVCKDAMGATVADNPDYHVPTKSSGFGDLGGGDLLITLSGFGFNFNAAPVAQAGTLMHELGHNFDRKHGGVALERNCKPNYVSVMSYLFQVHGIWMTNTATGEPALGVDFSGQTLNPLDENNLTDAPLTEVSGAIISPATYPTRWYAPPTFLHTGLGVTAANKHCDGSPKSASESMVRIDGTSAIDPIDWRVDGATTLSGVTQDINFNGGPIPNTSATDGPFAGSNDWAYINQWGLSQIGSRPNLGLLSLDVGFSDLGRGDPGRGDPGRGDPGRGDPGRGDPGRGDPGRGDPGRGDPGRGDPGAPPGDLDIATATNFAQAPFNLKAAKELKTVRLIWQPSFIRPEGTTVTSTVVRVEGTTVTPTNFANRVLIGQGIQGTTVVDTKPLNGKPVVYILFETLSNGAKSDFVIRPFTYK
jgi:hypothetical protein